MVLPSYTDFQLNTFQLPIDYVKRMKIKWQDRAWRNAQYFAISDSISHNSASISQKPNVS